MYWGLEYESRNGVTVDALSGLVETFDDVDVTSLIAPEMKSKPYVEADWLNKVNERIVHGVIPPSPVAEIKDVPKLKEVDLGSLSQEELLKELQIQVQIQRQHLSNLSTLELRDKEAAELMKESYVDVVTHLQAKKQYVSDLERKFQAQGDNLRNKRKKIAEETEAVDMIEQIAEAMRLGL